MKKIWLKDLKIKEVNKRKPTFIWMKEKDIYGIEYFDGCIYWYNKDWLKKYFENSNKFWSKTEYENWKETYFEDSNGYWWKVEEWKTIEYKNWKYYIDWEEADLIHR